MLYFFWSVLNVVAFGLLVVFLFKIVREAAAHWGRLRASLLLLVLLGACSRTSSKATPPVTSAPISGDVSDLTPGTYRPIIAQEFSYQCSLFVDVPSPEFKVTPRVFLGFSGILIGHKWEQLGPGVFRLQNGRLYYSTAHLLRWDLLGLPIYSQIKELRGSVALQ